MSYGYGLSASLFQLARAYTAIAHDGQVLPVSIFRTPGDQPVSGPQVFAPETVREMRAMLETVTAPGGTSPDAAVPGYRVGGKSGTAYKQGGHGYDKSKYRASFVGMAPMPNPRIVVAVSVDEPTAGSHFGGQVSGPVFSAIAGDTLRSLNIPPDMPVRQMVVSDDSASAPAGAPAPAQATTPAQGAKKLASRAGVGAKKMTVADNSKIRPGVER
jgi:cell division protein FtsI (penicillin-binding protein 3)